MGINNPRNVRHAAKQGWFVIDIPNSVFDETISYLGLVYWSKTNATGGVVSTFQPTCRFAFENEQDLAWFKLKWL